MELTRDDSTKEDGEQRNSTKENGEQRSGGPQPGGLETLDVGPFGSILSLVNTGNERDVNVLGGWGRWYH